MNTEAFKNAIAAIAKAGGGHLIVPAGTYKTLPFVLTSHMDLHLEAGAVIKAPDNFAEYGIPDPNEPFPPRPLLPAPPAGADRARSQGRPADHRPNLTDVAITGSGTIDGSGAIFWVCPTRPRAFIRPGAGLSPGPTWSISPASNGCTSTASP